MPSDLEEDLELALMALCDGRPAGPLFASQVTRAVGDVLRNNGLEGTVTTTEGGLKVQIRLQGEQRVKQIALDLTQLL